MHNNEMGIDIVNAISKNDDVILKKIYVTNYARTKKYVLENSGTNDQAKDIYQEAFIVMWRNVRNKKFIPMHERSLESYLFQIAKYKWLDQLRKTKRESKLKTDISFELKQFDEDEHANFQSENIEKSRIAFLKLGKECKRILNLFYFQKYNMEQIALEFGITNHSARNKKYRCIQQLRKFVNQL